MHLNNVTWRIQYWVWVNKNKKVISVSIYFDHTVISIYIFFIIII